MLWSKAKQSGLKEATMCWNLDDYSSATLGDTSGRNPVELEVQTNAPNAKAQTSTEPLKIGDMLELEEVAEG